jgi:similar to stage IV sporulation protein
VVIFVFLLEKWGLWPGYLLVSLRGRGVVKLLNLIARNGIYFWDLKYKGNLATMKIRPRDFKRLRPFIRKTRCKVNILQKKGAFSLIHFSKRRKGLVAGTVIFCLSLYLLSLGIWNIGVEGNTGVAREEIVSVLKKHGVQRGILKKDLDLPELERILLLEIEDLSWVGASIQGVYLRIQVAERLPEPVLDAEMLNLVASKDGLVADILVLAGQAEVKKGDTVSKGQLLISGKKVEKVYLNGDEFEERVSQTRARGLVEAHVWYESYQFVPLLRVQKIKSGQTARSLHLYLKDREHYLWGAREAPFRNYEVRKIKHSLVWRNLSLPVELISYGYWEIQVDLKSIPPREALREARTKALQEIESQLPQGIKIKKTLF